MSKKSKSIHFIQLYCVFVTIIELNQEYTINIMLKEKLMEISFGIPHMFLIIVEATKLQKF